MLTRREFAVSSLAASLPAMAAVPDRLRLGLMDLVFRRAGNPEAVAYAKKLGLPLMQVTLGRSQDGGSTLPLEDKSVHAAWRAGAREHGVRLHATYLDMLHVDCLKNSDKGAMWVRRAMEINNALGAPILMMVFFGRCGVQARSELDYTLGLCRELAAEAEQKGLVLGFENSSSGDDNIYAVDKVNSKAFRCWYDVGNSTFGGFHPPTEIRALGKDRICAFHFKDRGYFGDGAVLMREIIDSIAAIGFEGDAYLETPSPSGDVEADAKRNLDYLRRLMA